MQNYDIRYDDKYGQLAQIDVAAEGEGYEPWVNQTLTSVNDSVVRLAVIEGELVDWHSHEHEDEFFLVLEGRLELEVEGREPFLLGVHQGVTIPHGVVPMLLILATLPVLGFCIISSTTLVGESEGWLIAANLVCNSSYWFVWYLLARIPSLTDNWKGSVAIWNPAARMVLCSEFGVIAVILALTLFLQSRKRGFI